MTTLSERLTAIETSNPLIKEQMEKLEKKVDDGFIGVNGAIKNFDDKFTKFIEGLDDKYAQKSIEKDVNLLKKWFWVAFGAIGIIAWIITELLPVIKKIYG